MTVQTITDHNRGLCGKPNVPNNTPRSSVEESPAHCLCCGSQMRISECTSEGMQQLGMYWLFCSTCPKDKKVKTNS
jgi:hypothetical protein